MFNPHIHQQQQQQQQQQFHQHLRQLQQLFQQQQPPPPPPPQPAPAHHVPHHHHQTPRPMPVPQSAPTARMVNLCQATQTTIITPNPMLQGALLMQQMQGNMRGFAMGGQQFRQFFAAGTRSSLLGPVPMGVAIKSPMMGFPGARPFHPHARYYNNHNNNTTASTTTTHSSSSSSTSTTDTTSRPSDRRRDGEQMAIESSGDQPEASTSAKASDKPEIDNAAGGGEGSTEPSEESLGEPVVKKPRTEGPEEPKEPSVVEAQPVPMVETINLVEADGDVLSSECNSQLDDCILLDEGGSAAGSEVVELDLLETKAVVRSCPPAVSPSARLSEEVQQVNIPSAEVTQEKDICLTSPENQEEADEGVADGNSKFYCYLCSITCHNQQNFRSHMNSVSHQQRMMEIQHMSNACLVTLLPRVQESLQGTSKDGEKKSDLKRWCSTCQTHFSSSIMDHRRTKEHKLASKTAISSCTVCKKHFRTSQIFIEHLQSQEHRQKVEKENEGCGDSAKLTVMDTEGFLVEEEEGSEVEEEGEEEEQEEDDRPINEGDQDDSDKGDGWTSLKEVTLKNMDHDEQYDPDTVYGSSFFVPVAGFICRLCKQFYHFESSSLHSHCKSLKHFENLKKYKTLMSRKSEAAESCRKSVQAQDIVSPVPASNKDCKDDTSLGSGLNSVQPIITLPETTQQPEEQEEPSVSSVDLSSTSLLSTDCTDAGFPGMEDETASQDSVNQKEPADDKVEPEPDPEPADDKEEPEPEPAAADNKEEPEPEAADDKEEPEPDPAAAAEENEEEETEPVVVKGKKNSTGKAKAAPKRRSGRAANRR